MIFANEQGKTDLKYIWAAEKIVFRASQQTRCENKTKIHD